jgi:hypothetical protein
MVPALGVRRSASSGCKHVAPRPVHKADGKERWSRWPVERGEHRVSLMLGKRLANYIEWGTAAQSAAFHPFGTNGR